MDDKVATQIFDAPPLHGIEPDPDPGLPRYLIVLSGGTPGAMFPIAPGVVWIGRSEDNDFSMPEASVSRRHAGLRLDESGHAWLTDLGSTNGTFRNGLRIQPREPVPIRDGDRIRLGTKVVLKYACPDAEEERFQKSMFERTVRDPLTGLFNRSYFLDQLRILSIRAGYQGLGLAVLMLDIDRFKSINDSFGHDGGDAVLREVAGVIRQATRSEDLVARYGGEEFSVGLPVDSASLALERAEHIRATLARKKLRYARRTLRATVSVGLAYASLRQPQHVDALITAADRALYRAKNTGRNRVIRSMDAQFDTPKTVAVD